MASKAVTCLHTAEVIDRADGIRMVDPTVVGCITRRSGRMCHSSTAAGRPQWPGRNGQEFSADGTRKEVTHTAMAVARIGPLILSEVGPCRSRWPPSCSGPRPGPRRGRPSRCRAERRGGPPVRAARASRWAMLVSNQQATTRAIWPLAALKAGEPPGRRTPRAAKSAGQGGTNGSRHLGAIVVTFEQWSRTSRRWSGSSGLG